MVISTKVCFRKEKNITIKGDNDLENKNAARLVVVNLFCSVSDNCVVLSPYHDACFVGYN